VKIKQEISEHSKQVEIYENTLNYRPINWDVSVTSYFSFCKYYTANTMFGWFLLTCTSLAKHGGEVLKENSDS
jgi:hypothetical protein